MPFRFVAAKEPFWAKAVGTKGEMTSKALMSAVFRKGKQIVQGVFKTQTHKVGVKVSQVPKQAGKVQQVVTYRSQLTENKLYNVWQKIFPRVYFQSLASELGRQAAWRSVRNMPLFAFVGMVIAQHADKEEDQITEKIHEFVKNVNATSSPLLQKIQELSLEQFEFGQLIGQGCNAAVYEACLKTETTLEEDMTEGVGNAVINTTESLRNEQEVAVEENSEAETDDFPDTNSDITVLSMSDDTEESERAPLEFLVDVDDDFIDFPDSDSDISILSDLGSESDAEFEALPEQGTEMINQLVDPELSLSMSYTEILTTLRRNVKDTEDEMSEELMAENLEYNSLDSTILTGTSEKFDLAVKMMFNYGVESNADAIVREMARETIPARLAQSHAQMETWQNGHKVRKKCLPPHPNIVEMWGVFVDPVPRLPDCLLNYPAALPARINPQGIGRNMTMFLVMKKYQNTLGEYLTAFNPGFRERLILFTQLLEAVAHMRRHGIAHRDLKLDNIFLDTYREGVPQLVVGDFGCCLADDRHGLQIPYRTEHTDRGGNTALMAPEISTAEPGMFSYLDYDKSDLWATGALAYEILGADNPFYSHPNQGRLDSRTYTEDTLPPLPDKVPDIVKNLVLSVLSRQQNKRPTARLAADVMQVFLWAPSDWLSQGKDLTKSEVNWWLVSMATEVLLGVKSAERDLKKCFLENVNINRLKTVFPFLGLQLE